MLLPSRVLSISAIVHSWTRPDIRRISLVWLLITQIYDHQSNLAQGGVPLMVIDAWEHAYYLQYQNRKTEFFEAMWAMWDWKDIAARYASAIRLTIDIGKAA